MIRVKGTRAGVEIEALEIGARAYNVFKSAGIDTVEDLCLLTAQQLLGL
jgi:DNA-directed RNA polymerase alpha subunit